MNNERKHKPDFRAAKLAGPLTSATVTMPPSILSLRPVVHFTNDIAGLEKSLRFAQGLCTLAVGLASSKKDAEVYSRAQAQFALSERPPSA